MARVCSIKARKVTGLTMLSCSVQVIGLSLEIKPTRASSGEILQRLHEPVGTAPAAVEICCPC
jgi:hypothetical protein